MYALVMWIGDEPTTSVVLWHDVEVNGKKTRAKWGPKYWPVQVLRQSPDKDWLESLSVIANGQVIWGRRQEEQIGSAPKKQKLNNDENTNDVGKKASRMFENTDEKPRFANVVESDEDNCNGRENSSDEESEKNYSGDEAVKNDSDDEAVKNDSDDETVKNDSDEEPSKNDSDEEPSKNDSDEEPSKNDSDENNENDNDDETVKNDSDEETRKNDSDEKNKNDSDDDTVKNFSDEEVSKNYTTEKNDSDEKNNTDENYSDDETVKNFSDEEVTKNDTTEKNDNDKKNNTNDSSSSSSNFDDSDATRSIKIRKVKSPSRVGPFRCCLDECRLNLKLTQEIVDVCKQLVVHMEKTFLARQRNSGRIPPKGKIELLPGSGVWVSNIDVSDITNTCAKKPKEMTRRLMRSILSKEKLMNMTPRGRGSRQAIPKNIVTAVETFVKENTMPALQLSHTEYTRCLTLMCSTLRNAKPSTSESPKLRSASSTDQLRYKLRSNSDRRADDRRKRRESFKELTKTLALKRQTVSSDGSRKYKRIVQRKY